MSSEVKSKLGRFEVTHTHQYYVNVIPPQKWLINGVVYQYHYLASPYLTLQRLRHRCLLHPLGRCDGPSQDRCLSAEHADAGDANLRKTLAQRQITLDLYTMTIGQKQKYKIICRKKRIRYMIYMYACMYTRIYHMLRALSLSPPPLFLNFSIICNIYIYIYSIYTKDRDRLIDRYGTANSR